MITSIKEQRFLNERIGRALWLRVQEVEEDRVPSPLSITMYLLIVQYNAMMKDRKTWKGYQNANG